MKRAGILLTLLFIATPLVGWAQELPGINTPLSVAVTPTIPAPGQALSLQAQSSSFDIDTANISWSVNGKVVEQGIGDKTLDIQVGPLGNSTKIVTSATTPDGQSFSVATNINPSQIGLIWEADTYTPPFYKGKALRSWGASYKVIAVPQVVINGVVVKASSLIYTWSKNNTIDGTVSGYGKYIYQSDDSVSYTRGGDEIDVTVSTSAGTEVGEASIVVPVTQAEMFIYQDSPIYGVLYNQAVGTAALNEDSISFQAVPFFFSDVQSAIGSLVWTMNGTSVPTFAGNPSITLARQNKDAGTSIISASLQSPSSLLQEAEKSVTININAQK